MRCLFFAVLVAIPTALVTWVLTKGSMAPPEETLIASVKPGDRAVPRGAAVNPDQALRALFSGALGGVSRQGDLALLDKQTLFDHINGGAPAYIERGFRKLAAAEMATADGHELTCDVYDMATAANATAMFAAEKPPDAKSASVGEESRTSSMSLIFRKGPYYVKLTAFDADAEAKLPALAKELAGKMP